MGGRERESYISNLSMPHRHNTEPHNGQFVLPHPLPIVWSHLERQGGANQHGNLSLTQQGALFAKHYRGRAQDVVSTTSRRMLILPSLLP